MVTMEFTPAQASAVANLPLRTVHKLIERRLIRPRLRRTGRSLQRMLTREQLLYLRLEAKGVRLLPMATRRVIDRETKQGLVDRIEGKISLGGNLTDEQRQSLLEIANNWFIGL